MINVERIAPESPSTDEQPARGTKRRRAGILFGGLLTLIAIGVAAALVLSASGGGKPNGPAGYDITINNGWPQIEDEKQVGGYLENAWHDPEGPTLAIDSRLSDETGSPMANAELAQIQTSKLPGYRERGLKKIRLGGRPAVSWGFNVSNEESRMEFFFEECDTTFVARGSMGTIGFEAYSRSFREMLATLKASCDE